MIIVVVVSVTIKTGGPSGPEVLLTLANVGDMQ